MEKKKEHEKASGITGGYIGFILKVLHDSILDAGSKDAGFLVTGACSKQFGAAFFRVSMIRTIRHGGPVHINPTSGGRSRQRISRG